MNPDTQIKHRSGTHKLQKILRFRHIGVFKNSCERQDFFPTPNPILYTDMNLRSDFDDNHFQSF